MMVVKGKAYRTNLPGTLQLRVLRKMKEEFGVGWGSVANYMSTVTEESLIGDLLGDVEFLAWMCAWILNAGDSTSRADLEKLTVGDVDFTETDAPGIGEEPAVDPTSAPTDSRRGDASPRGQSAKRTPGSTKTSKKPSSPASS